MVLKAASRPLGRVWDGRIDARSGIRVEYTDSLGVPVVILSDGTESVVIPADRLHDVEAMVKRARVAHELRVAGS